MSNPNQYQKASQVPKESIISSLREELSILKDIHKQTVKAGIVGFEAMAAENALLKVDNELLRHLSFRDERNKLKEQIAESQDDNTKLRSAVSRMADENIGFKEQLAQQSAVIEQMREALDYLGNNLGEYALAMQTPTAKINQNYINIRRAIRRVVKAEVAYSWIGTMELCDRAAIIQEVKMARSALNRMITKVVI